MCVRLRLYRMGRRNLPTYRIVATDSRSAPRGRFLEMLGSYRPIPSFTSESKYLRLKTDRVKYWLGVGAQPSDTVARLLSKVDLLPEPPTRSTVPKEKLVGTYTMSPAIIPRLLNAQARGKTNALDNVKEFIPRPSPPQETTSASSSAN